MKRRSQDRGKARGFSLLEAMVAAGMLGVGLIGLVRLHTTAIQGIKATRERGTASDIASQYADYLATQPLDTLIKYGCTPPTGPDWGCKQGTNPLSSSFSPTIRLGQDMNHPCSRWVAGAPIPDANGDSSPSALDSASAMASGFNYRIDEVLLSPANPTNGNMVLDGTNHPNGAIVQVYVCWIDDQNWIRQTMTSRFIGL